MNSSARDFFALAVAESDRPMPHIIPYHVAYAIAWFGGRITRLLRRKDTAMNTDAISLANVFREMNSGKAQRELGWQPRPIAETVLDAVTWFRSRNAVEDVRQGSRKSG